MASNFTFISKKTECKIPFFSGCWSVWKVLRHVAFSPSLFLCTAFLAPILWALLPLGYAILNGNKEIFAHPVMTVFVRMSLSFVGSLFILGLILLITFFKEREILKSMWYRFWGSKKTWLFLFFFPTGYFLARWLEMEMILGGMYEDSVKAYGYFMGLLLVVILPMLKNKTPGKDITVNESLLWICTLFIVLSSGILNIVARTSNINWVDVSKMFGISFGVALFSWIYVMFKQAGKVDCQDTDNGNELKKKHPYIVSFLSASTMNVIMCLGAAIWSYIYILTCDKSIASVTDFKNIWALYWEGSESGIWYSEWFWILVIVVLCTVIAPMAQLIGVSRHDIVMKEREMARFGVSGGDWLVVCGGFEPMFVVIVSCALYVFFPEDKLERFKLDNFEAWPIILCFALVLAIALIRIVKIWSEKSAALRNAIFAYKRGSTHADLSTKTNNELQSRAEELVFLKLYHKRKDLIDVKLGVSESKNLNDWLDDWLENDSGYDNKDKENIIKALNAWSNGDTCYYVVVEGANKYFTQDDPFTNDVLAAQFSWLQKEFSDVSIDSFSRVFKKKIDNEKKWKSFKKAVCGAYVEATPFVLKGGSVENIKKFCNTWDSFLKALKSTVDNGEISLYVNEMMITFKGDA